MAAEVERSQNERQSQQQSEASLNVSGVDSSPVDQYEILSKVLGERSDYQRGVGYRAKGKAKKTFSSSTDQSQSQANTAASPNEDMRVMALLVKAIRETFETSTTVHPSKMYNPMFDSFLQRHLPPQSEGGSSSQSPSQQYQPPSQQYQPPSHQQYQPPSQQQFQPPSQYPPQQLYQPHPMYPPHMSSQQPPQYQNQYIFGPHSQSPPQYFSFTDFPGGSMQPPPQPQPRELFGDLTLGRSSQPPYIPSPPPPRPPQPPPPPPPSSQPSSSQPDQNVEDEDNFNINLNDFL
ncbi:early nodulin-75-like [Humulus lupulus]|uniref:early nodulin-75-like n=1 Tax=Humulus lupulus TaxID=3486 RepID=UPI002B4124A6|nr:early nodulin-75-like [Humulus lupulus]